MGDKGREGSKISKNGWRHLWTAPKIYLNFSGSGMTLLCILPQEIHCDSSRCTLHTKNLADLVHPYLKTNYNSGSRTRKVSTYILAFFVTNSIKFLILENYRMTVQFYVLVTHQHLKMIKKILNSMNVTKCGLMNLIKKVDALFWTLRNQLWSNLSKVFKHYT